MYCKISSKDLTAWFLLCIWRDVLSQSVTIRTFDLGVPVLTLEFQSTPCRHARRFRVHFTFYTSISVPYDKWTQKCPAQVTILCGDHKPWMNTVFTTSIGITDPRDMKKGIELCNGIYKAQGKRRTAQHETKRLDLNFFCPRTVFRRPTMILGSQIKWLHVWQPWAFYSHFRI